jgi:hypothetical protein
MTPLTNMRVLTPSRKRLNPGDVFVLQPDERYLFGRVIGTNTAVGPMTGCILTYIYRVRSASMQIPPRPDLSPDKLLIPPIMTNRLPWSRGYFETIAHVPLEAGDVLTQHCFRSSGGKYYDEANNELPGPIEPVGVRGLHSYRTIDDAVSDALGIARVPD